MSIETIAVEVEKKVVVGVEDAIHVGSDVFKLLSDAQKLSPAFKAELSTLIADCAPIATALSPVIVTEGANVATDLAAIAPIIAAIKKLVTDFTSFLPTIKLAVADVAADTK